MYNKLFTKILDSSIWLESASTRLVWLTMIAAMDETGFAQFASVPNLAHRARVSLEEAEAAAACLQAPDANSSDPENDGRRIERVPGGWMVLNADKYREMVTRSVARERTRARVEKHRAGKQASCNAHVTPCNASPQPVTLVKRSVTQSETDTDTQSETEAEAETPPSSPASPPAPRRQKPPERGDFDVFWSAYPRKTAKEEARKAWVKIDVDLDIVLAAIGQQRRSAQWMRDGGQFIPHAATWLNQKRWEDETTANQGRYAGHYPESTEGIELL